MISIVHALRRAKGSNAKLKILKSHSNNFQWIKFLSYTYDSSKNYYVSPPADTTFIDDLCDYNEMFNVLDRLSTGNYIGQSGRDIAKSASKLYGEVFRLVLAGSINAGVSVTTINKAYPGAIPEFKVMLAEDVVVTKFPILASTKYDGVRVLAFVYADETILRTRSGKQLNIDSLVRNMSKYPEGVYDGELVLGNGLQNDRTGITGHVNSVLKGGSTDIPGYSYVIFDYMPLEDWENKNSSKDYLTRLRELNNFHIPDISIRYSEQTSVNSAKEIESLYEDRIAKGYEGLILRYPEDPYVWSRSSMLIKKKAIKECVLTCTGVKEGTGKYAGAIGSLLCEGKVEGKVVRVNVGSGLSKFDVFQEPEHYIGSKIEVLYNDVIKSDSNEFYSLFLPRFKRKQNNMDV
jgi:DNA ligase-1